MTTAATTRSRHRAADTDGAAGISAADLLARYSEAGFDRPSRAGRRAAERDHEMLAPEPGPVSDTVITRDAPAGLRGSDVPPAGLVRGATSETGSFGRNPRAVVATMGATVMGATAVMGVVTAFDSPADTENDLQTRSVGLAGAEQATMKLNTVGSGHSAAGSAIADGSAGMVSTAFQQADGARIAATNLAAAKKAADAKAAADRTNSAKQADGPDLSALSSLGLRALAEAKTRLGMPYVWGATGPDEFDCSGLMQWAFEQLGKDLPRSSAAQSKVGTPVSKDELRPGDLVFFYSPVSHVGIYAGNGKVLNASESGEPVKYSDIDNMPFHNARRI